MKTANIALENNVSNPASELFAHMGRGLTDAVQAIKFWRQRARSRRALSQLPAEALLDIGIDEMDAMLECNKPFWRS